MAGEYDGMRKSIYGDLGVLRIDFRGATQFHE